MRKGVVDLEFTNKLTKAFAIMRNFGLIAKQNYLCCQSCGCFGMATLANELKDKGKEPIGYAFYHNQDKANMVKSGKFYIAYGGFDTTKYGKFGLDDKTVGEKIMKALKLLDIEAEWNGNPNTRIFVKVS